MIPAILGLMGSALAVGGSAAANAASNEANAVENDKNRHFALETINRQSAINSEQAELADARQRQQYWDLYSPEARVQQLKDAGLSVGLMYGQGGAGGTGNASGNQAMAGTGLNNSSIPNKSIFDANAANLTATAALQAAQIENIKADTANKEKDLNVKDETMLNLKKERDQIDENIKYIHEQVNLSIENQRKTIAETATEEEKRKLYSAQQDETYMKAAYLKTQDEMLNIQIKWEDKISEATLNKIKTEAKKLKYEAEKAKVEGDILERSKNAICQKYNNDALQSAAQLAKTKEEKELVKTIAERTKQENANYQALVKDIDNEYKRLPKWMREKNKPFYDLMKHMISNMGTVSQIVGSTLTAGAIMKK